MLKNYFDKEKEHYNSEKYGKDRGQYCVQKDGANFSLAFIFRRLSFFNIYRWHVCVTARCAVLCYIPSFNFSRILFRISVSIFGFSLMNWRVASYPRPSFTSSPESGW